MEQPQKPLRLNKFLAERLGVSRREADGLISAGKITVNGKTPSLGAKIDKSDKVCYNNRVVPHQADFLYLAFNKPVGYVCSRRAQGSAPTLYELLPKKYHHLKTVGRLDKDSSGLILLTNDGDFAFQMTHPKFRKNKVYEVELDKPLEPLHQQMISEFGVQLDDGPSQFKIIRGEPELPLSKGFRSAAAREGARLARGDRTTEREKSKLACFSEPGSSVSLDGPRRRDPRETVIPAHYTVILAEGRNRQIRRTFAALGYKVTKLHRTNFGKYELGDLKPGKCATIVP